MYQEQPDNMMVVSSASQNILQGGVRFGLSIQDIHVCYEHEEASKVRQLVRRNSIAGTPNL
jgi:hypothetical protein